MCVNNNGMELWGNKYVGTRSQSVSRLYIPPTTPRSIHPLRDWSCVCGDQREREIQSPHDNDEEEERGLLCKQQPRPVWMTDRSVPLAWFPVWWPQHHDDVDDRNN